MALEQLDLSIRATVKGIVGLPTSTSTDMFYAPRKFRGLGILQCEWEVFLQHFAISKKLQAVPDALLHSVHDCAAEMELCQQALGVQGEGVRQLRSLLRERAFDKWAAMDYQGVGVRHFKAFPKANAFV